MNTRIEYMYRDGENYKLFHEVVVAGVVDIGQLQPHFFEGSFFMPSAVGLDDLQERPYRDCDHVWHELECAEATDAQPTVSTTAEELLARFSAVGRAGWSAKIVSARMAEIQRFMV